MKQEHDFEGALEDMPDSNDGNYPNEREYYACLFNWVVVNEAAIRAALTAAKYKPVTFQDVQRWASIVVSDIEGGYSSEEVKTANAICYATAGEPPQDGGDDDER